MAQSRKRSAAQSPTPATEPPTKRRRSAPLSVEQKIKLRKAVLYLAPRFPSKHPTPYTYLGIFDEVRALLGLDHLSKSLQRHFSAWLKENKDGEWERMKKQAERDGRETYFADLIELDGGGEHQAKAEGDEPSVERQTREHAKKLTNDEKLAVAKTVLYLAPRTVGGESRRHKNTGEWQVTSRWLYPVVKELLGLEQTAESLLTGFRRWLKKNKIEWEEMKAQSEREADYFDELIECEDVLIREGVLDDTRPAFSVSAGPPHFVNVKQEEGEETNEAQQAEPTGFPSRPESPHFVHVKQEAEAGEEEDDSESSGSGSTLLCYDVSRDDYTPAFDGNNSGNEDDEKPREEGRDKGEEAGHPTSGGATTEPVILHYHEHHYHHTVYNYYGSMPQEEAHFPPPPQQQR